MGIVTLGLNSYIWFLSIELLLFNLLALSLSIFYKRNKSKTYQEMFCSLRLLLNGFS